MMKTNFRAGVMLLVMILLTSISLQAQTTFSATGHVSDENGEALIGVSIKAKNSKIAAMTDYDGNYSISLDRPTELIFEYVGMKSHTLKVSKAGVYDVIMLPSSTNLDDVVVVGYGVQKKVNLTGAVQSVSSTEIVKRSVSNGSMVLQGMVPGLTATQGSGAPGGDQASIRIRGIGSINSTQSPLVLIDGVEGDMNRIDLNQIESISVLKDGASASIYGTRASNGVILVTTKRGAQGKIKVSFNGYVGWNKPTDMPKSVDAIGYLSAVDIARVNNDQEPLYAELIETYRNEGADNISRYDTNWRDLIMKKDAMVQNYSISASGGSENVRVFASAGYYKQDGMVPNNYFSRTNLRVNTDMKINKWVSLGADLGIRQANVENPIGGSTTLIGYAMTFVPTWSAINADGTWGYGLQGNNPVATIRDGGYSRSVAPEYTAKLSLNINPFKGMNILGYYTWKRNDGKTNAFANTYQEYEGGVLMGTFPTKLKSASEERTSSVLKQYNLVGTYENTFAEKHYLKAMVGFQSEDYDYNSLSAGRSDYRYEGYEDILHGDASTSKNNSYRYSWAMLSYVFRLNYVFADRYLLELNGRYDGSSRFLGKNRWGFFPSASAGWRISEENFFEGIRSTVDNLKLRVSYGKLGNQNIGSYFPYLAAISSNDAYGYWFDGVYSPGVAQVQLANTIISWEKSKQFDVGLDFGLFNSRLSGSFDYYIRNIDDMLQQFPVPEFVAMTSPWVNGGSMRNNGWELSLEWADRIGDVSYYIKGNLSDVRNKVTNLYGNEYKSGGRITAEGLPISSIYGYVANGFFTSYDEINAKDESGNFIHAVYGDRANVKPGFIKYRDISGPDGVPDGKIDGDDRTVIGDPRAHYEFGLTLGGEWKGIDFSVFFQGVGKKDVYYSGSGAKPFIGNGTIYEYQLDTWTEDNPNAKFPLLLQDPNGNLANNMLSSHWVQSGAYCRLKNLVIGYTLPRKLTRKAMIERVRIYASGQNLFTIRGDNFYKGFDPEASIGSGVSCYPLNKTYLIGLNLEF